VLKAFQVCLANCQLLFAICYLLFAICYLLFAICYLLSGLRPPRTPPATYPTKISCARMHPFRTHSSSSEAAVTCDPYDRPLTTEVQAVSGFPASQFLMLAAGPLAPLPPDPASISHRTKSVVNRRILYLCLITRRFVNQPNYYVR
jgi:hypothetical protein